MFLITGSESFSQKPREMPSFLPTFIVSQTLFRSIILSKFWVDSLFTQERFSTFKMPACRYVVCVCGIDLWSVVLTDTALLQNQSVMDIKELGTAGNDGGEMNLG